MKEAKGWQKILEDSRQIEKILVEEKYSEKNQKRITVILTQVAFEVFVHKIQKQVGTYQEKMRYENRLDSLKSYNVVKPYILRDLNILYKIRNQYAHTLKPDEQLIKGYENDLKLWTEKTQKVAQKNKYVFASSVCLAELEKGLQRALGVC